MPGQLPPPISCYSSRWSVSLDVYAAYQTGLIAVFALVFLAAGALLFQRRSDDRIALLVSLWLVLIGVTGNPLLDPLIRDYPAWQTPVRFLQGAAIGCFPIFTYLFPDGRFRPALDAHPCNHLGRLDRGRAVHALHGRGSPPAPQRSGLVC